MLLFPRCRALEHNPDIFVRGGSIAGPLAGGAEAAAGACVSGVTWDGVHAAADAAAVATAAAALFVPFLAGAAVGLPLPTATAGVVARGAGSGGGRGGGSGADAGREGGRHDEAPRRRLRKNSLMDDER